MSIIPTGNPSWVRSVGFEDYGGHAQKQNYQSQGVVNPRTDVGAEAFARLTSDLAAAVRTVPFAIITFTCNDSSPAAPTVHSVLMQTGISLVSYPGASPPSGFPSAARVGDGAVTFTFAETYDDPYGVEAAFGIQHATAGAHSSTTDSLNCTVNFTATGQTITVRCFQGTTAKANAKITLKVW